MNDDFEKRLERQPMRTVPSDWREEILVAARAGAVQPAALARLGWREWPALVCLKLWRELFWPSRYAWGGIAAVWLAMLMINEALYDSSSSTQAKVAPSAEVIQAVQVQRRLLMELAGPVGEREIASPKNDRPRPHSRRETEFFLT